MIREIELTFPAPAVRAGDPETSYAAAAMAAITSNEHCILALRTLRDYGPCTDYELSAITNLQQNSIGKRRGDCRDVGLVSILYDADANKVKRPAPSGAKCLVWTLTMKGVFHLADYEASCHAPRVT